MQDHTPSSDGLATHGVLGTPSEARLDRLTSLAARLLNAPLALIALRHADNLRFQSAHGTGMRECPLFPLAASGEVVVVTDTALNPALRSHPLIAAERLRFAAFAPLSAAGASDGYLAVFDRQPRPFTAEHSATLSDLAAIVTDEWELRRAERCYCESEHLLASVFDLVPVGLSVIDEDARYVRVNRAYCDLMGLPAGQIGGRPFYDLLPDEIRDSALAAHRAFLAGGRMPRQWSFRNQLGVQVELECTASLVTGADGRPYRVTAFADVSSLGRKEKELRASHERIHNILETITDGFISLDREWRFTYVNREAARQLRRSDLVGRIIWEEFPALRGTRSEALYRQAMEEQKPAHFEESSRASGEWFEVHLYPAPDALSIYFRNITESRKAKLAVQEATETLHAIIEASPAAIWAIDLEGRIHFWNATAERLFGWSEDEVLGKWPPYLATPEDHRDYRDLVARYARGEVMKGMERRRRRKDGSAFDLCAWTAPLRNPEGAVEGTLAVAVDTTERKQLEAQLLQAQKMEAVALLAGGVAHDFNNLLTVIIGYGRMLQMDPAHSELEHQYASEIVYAGERAAALTGQLLAFSRRQITQPKILDLNEIVLGMDHMLRRTLGEDIELITFLGDKLGRVKADPGQMDQVLANLAVNARDAMPSGGKLIVETVNETSGSGRYVVLSVTDTGTGIRPDLMGRIFEPFFTTKEKGKGTGLGLSIIHGIVKQSGGEILVSSEPGRGTTFRIKLPMVEGPPEQAGRRLGGDLPRGSETILVVEDENSVRRLIAGILKSVGYTVLDAPGGRDALAILEREKVDLLLTDVIMPEITGPELVRQVSPRCPRMKVLYMSGYTDKAVLPHQSGGSEAPLLQKPFTPESIARKVREVLGP